MRGVNPPDWEGEKELIDIITHLFKEKATVFTSSENSKTFN
jgi:hypothetical protein